MKIVVNHVTRMKERRICVAGIDPDTLAHIRPTTTPTDVLTRSFLRSEGGPFAPGAVVDLGRVRRVGVAPEVEDHRFFSENARHVEDLSNDEYVEVLDEVKREGIVDAFGPEIREIRPRKLAVPKGRGERSLAVMELRSPRIFTAWEKLWLDLSDGHIGARLRVTDVRFYDGNNVIQRRIVNDVATRIKRGTKAYCMLGLAHPILDEEAGWVHWLQCNGLCLVDRAAGEVP